MLPRLMPAMVIQMKRLLAQSLPFQVAYSKLNSFLLARLPRNFKFPLSTSFLQVLLVPGQSGGNGASATPPGSMTRSSGLANVPMLLRLMPAMAIQMKRLLAQVACSKLNSFFCGHHVIHLFLNLTVQ